MKYYFTVTKKANFDDIIDQTKAALKEQGFGVLTEIAIDKVMKEKLDADMPPYRILGACNPEFAYKALQKEDKIGTMLPCNVILQQKEGDSVEVSAVDPVVSMIGIDNDKLENIASEVRTRLIMALESL